MIKRSTFFKLVLSGIVIFSVVVVALNLISYNRNFNEFEFSDDNHGYAIGNRDGNALVRIKADVKSNSKPAELEVNEGKVEIPKVRVRTYMIAMSHDQDQHILVREAGESSFHILLLHGQAFSSKIWEDLGTLQYLASWGYQAYAIDLPGYGNSSLPVVQEAAAVQWLTRLIRALRLVDFVIISPSMSGRFTIPYVIHANTKQRAIRGFVPIAPVVSQNFGANEFKQVNIPTLIVHGENDTKFQPAIETLKQIPSSEVLTIKNASHVCYVEQPIEFHNGLRQFLYSVYRPIYIEEYKQRSSSSMSAKNPLPPVDSNKEQITDNGIPKGKHHHVH